MANAPENTDDLKGRVKEATGSLTGNDDLEREGKVDQLMGKVKGAVEDIGDRAKDLLDGDKNSSN